MPEQVISDRVSGLGVGGSEALIRFAEMGEQEELGRVGDNPPGTGVDERFKMSSAKMVLIDESDAEPS